MAQLKIRYLVEKPGRAGPRFFWQPTKPLKTQGWHSRRLAAGIHDPAKARTMAIEEAETLNGELDAWRRGELPDRAAGPTPGTVAALIADYRLSRRYRRLRASTQRTYEWYLKVIEAWAGDAPATAITAPLVQKFYEAMLERTPTKANAAITHLRLLYNHGRRAGLLRDNPAERPGLEQRAPSGRVWSGAAIAAFVAAADAMGRHSVGTAVALNAWLGQRQGDILAMSRAAYRDGQIAITQRKTGAEVALPVDLVPRLRQRLEAELARQEQAKVTATTIIVSETTGRAYATDNFKHVFAEIRSAAVHTAETAGKTALAVELASLWFMHLRHTAVTRLAEAGCELPWIAAITGHTLTTCQAILDRYMVRTSAMAEAAFRRRLEHEERDA